MACVSVPGVALDACNKPWAELEYAYFRRMELRRCSSGTSGASPRGRSKPRHRVEGRAQGLGCAEKMFRKAIELDSKQTHARWNLSRGRKTRKNGIDDLLCSDESALRCSSGPRRGTTRRQGRVRGAGGGGCCAMRVPSCGRNRCWVFKILNRGPCAHCLKTARHAVSDTEAAALPPRAQTGAGIRR